MLQETDSSPQRQGNDASVSQGRHGADALRPLIDRLEQLGFIVPPFYGRQNKVAGGVPMQLSVRKWLRSSTGPGTAINVIRTLLRDHISLTLSLSDLGSGDAAIDALQSFCDVLRSEMANDQRSCESIKFCIRSHQLPLQAFQAIAESVPGGGPRYMLLDELQMAQSSNSRVESDTDKNWSFLWRNRMTSPALRPAYGVTVRTACPLLADESTASILPVHGIQVPADSAWLPVSLALPRFADDSGDLEWRQLLRALVGGVELLDKIMDRLQWPHPGQQADARLNRRLAISITGLGDLVARRRLDPEDLDTLRWLSAIIVRIRKILWQRSSQMARINGCLPALCGSDPSARWDDCAHRESWQHRWRIALEKSAVRHRNMLILSPYSVLPSTTVGDAGYTDLLPVIANADAWSFADVPSFRGWNLDEYKTFHKRAWAVIQGCKTGTLVAAGV